MNPSVFKITHDPIYPLTPSPTSPQNFGPVPGTAELQGILALSLLSWNFDSWLAFALPPLILFLTRLSPLRR